MIEILKTLPSPALIAIIIALAFMFKLVGQGIGFIFTELWANRKAQVERHDLALSANTMAIVKLQVQIEQLNEFLVVIPKLREDINFAHLKIRDLQNGQNP